MLGHYYRIVLLTQQRHICHKYSFISTKFIQVRSMASSNETYDFDYFVIGGGSGGVRSARIAAKHGARVGLAEDNKFGIQKIVLFLFLLIYFV